MIIQKICGHACRIISTILGLSSEGTSWGGAAIKNGVKCEWTYFSDFGPMTLIARGDQSRSLMGLFAVNVGYDSPDQSGRILSCRLVVLDREKQDRVTIGYPSAFREFCRLNQLGRRNEGPRVGMVD